METSVGNDNTKQGPHLRLLARRIGDAIFPWLLFGIIIYFLGVDTLRLVGRLTGEFFWILTGLNPLQDIEFFTQAEWTPAILFGMFVALYYILQSIVVSPVPSSSLSDQEETARRARQSDNYSI